MCVHNWLACNIWHQSIWNEKCNPGLLHYANTVPALTWDVLVPLNSKWTTIFHIFLSLNIWNAFCVLLWRKYEFMRSVNHCMFVFTFYTVFHQFFLKFWRCTTNASGIKQKGTGIFYLDKTQIRRLITFVSTLKIWPIVSAQLALLMCFKQEHNRT